MFLFCCSQKFLLNLYNEVSFIKVQYLLLHLLHQFAIFITNAPEKLNITYKIMIILPISSLRSWRQVTRISKASFAMLQSLVDIKFCLTQTPPCKLWQSLSLPVLPWDPETIYQLMLVYNNFFSFFYNKKKKKRVQNPISNNLFCLLKGKNRFCLLMWG
jgi:hypothetical protein